MGHIIQNLQKLSVRSMLAWLEAEQLVLRNQTGSAHNSVGSDEMAILD